MLKQLLRIFVDNSIKYTPPGGEIIINSKVKGDELVLIVKDSGIGIPEEDIPHIFKRFYQVDKSRSDKKNGTGLGLSIAGWIVDIHHGRIEVDSKKDAGTTIKVFLPMQ